jgi:fructose 1,6-bisphosphate aldolase/phosphatase
MKTTLSVIKADVGSIGGHVAPSRELVEAVEQHVREKGRHLFLDVYSSHTGDDGAILMTHTQGVVDEQEYTGITEKLAALDERFQVRAGSR